MNPQDSLCLNRADLRMGKYTKWAAELSGDELLALLWMLGEYGIRAPIRAPRQPGEGIDGAGGRGEAARQALLDFVGGRPLSMEQAMERIRDAGDQPPSSTV